MLVPSAVPLVVTLAALAALPGLAGCAVYDGPPEVTIQGLTEGLLPDPHAPIVLVFSKPPQPQTVKIEIAKYIVDSEGRLGDEPGNTLGTDGLDTIYTYDPVDGDTGGSEVFAADDSTMTITPSVVPPVGGSLVVLVEPGIADATGAVTKVRRRIVFGYASELTCNAPATVVGSGVYFFLVSVQDPIAVQIQLFGSVVVDPATGHLSGEFTKAKRNPDVTRCSPACPTGDVCQLVPTQQCVIPSTVAASVDEFSDYVPNPDAPTGFAFATQGCVIDQGPTTAAFATSPVDVQVTSPMVTLRNAALSSAFSPDGMGTLRGTGSLTADAVLLGTIDSGPGHGDLTARSTAPQDVPPGVPGPTGN
jgi:hypothetical protein